MEYNFREIEKKWQEKWAKSKPFKAEDNSIKPKYYVLDMFPYPSGAGLHVGHPLGYIASDILARYKRLKGFNVLHPMGYDSFGLPAEQYAIQTGQHPAITTEQNIKRYREQLDKIGFSFDWDREVRTSDPAYYKWTQWIFIQLFNSWYDPKTNKAEKIETLIAEFEKNGNINISNENAAEIFTAAQWKTFDEKKRSEILMNYRIAYLGEAFVNWCPALGTVLANDEVKDGVSERGGHPVERKLMKQWSMRITAYAQRLLDGLEKIDWSESLKESQRNWIGRSEGSSLKFKVLTPNPSPKERGTSTQSYLTGKTEIIKELLERAKSNRKDSTKAEAILWEALRNKNIGIKFRRQHPIDQFIVDFVSLDNKLIIEVDGGYHDEVAQKELDEIRTAILNSQGFNLIRFTNNEVENNLAEVIEKIKKACISGLSPNASPSLEERGPGGEDIEVFSTRPDTIFGATFITLAPEHELVEKITTPDRKKAIDDYLTFAKNRSERERMADVKKITGEFTGAYVEHPFTGKPMPIWVGDYVLAGYGTGAVMGVPAHDSRDYAFAKHFNLSIVEVVAGGDISKESYDAKEGKLINSDFLNGLDVNDAVKRAIQEIEKQKIGKGKINFRLRDAVFGRQRYWGEPIPVYYKDGIAHVLPENELPLVLPEVDKFLPTESGEPPLARATNWKYQGKYEYEHTTMPGWAGSSWYYLRYMDAHNEKEFVSKQAADYWKNVDLYLGGSEHATGHLLYVRFWTMFLKDMGYINIDEPAKKLINQGMIQGTSSFIYRLQGIDGNAISNETPILISYDLLQNDISLRGVLKKEIEKLAPLYSSKIEHNDRAYAIITNKLNVDVNIVSNNILNKDALGDWREEYKNAKLITNENGDYICGVEVEKMSKSKYNVVSPDSICEQYGADCLRLYEMFLGPLEQSKPWNTNGITGVVGFLKKLWKLFHDAQLNFVISDEAPTKPELKTLHKTIKKIHDDIERFSFNTSVSNFMICVNELTELKCNKRAILEPLTILIASYAPHIAEELWSLLGHKDSITFAKFPDYKEEYMVDDSFAYPVSFNGKTRFKMELPLSMGIQEIEKEVLSSEEAIKYLDGKTPKKIIIVPKKIVNIVL